MSEKKLTEDDSDCEDIQDTINSLKKVIESHEESPNKYVRDQYVKMLDEYTKELENKLKQ